MRITMQTLSGRVLGFEGTEHGIRKCAGANAEVMVLLTRSHSDLNNSVSIHTESHIMDYFPHR